MSEMAAEEADGEEQEDVLALTEVPAALASPRRDGGEAGETVEKEDGGENEVPVAEPVDEAFAPVELGERGGGRTAGEIAADWPGVMAGEAPPDGDSGTEAELWKDGPVWTVRGGSAEIDTAQKLALVERVEQTADALRTARSGRAGGMELAHSVAEPGGPVDGLEQAVRMQAAGTALDGVRQASASAAGSGLEGLYRQAVEAARPAAPALAPERAGRTVRVQEPGSAASLAVDELDRAVRRDSRRYDGGLSIF